MQFSANSHLWDQSKLLRANLETVLEMQLPSPQTTEKEDFSGDCCICYAYKLDSGATPDRVCDNLRCRRPYHPSCLLSWLQQLPNSRTSLGMVFGMCTYCGADISVKTTS